MKACKSCADECAETFHHCDREVATGKKEPTEVLRLVAGLQRQLMDEQASGKAPS
jgi:hypothetical protein